MEEHRSARSKSTEGVKEPAPFDSQNQDHRQILVEMLENPASFRGTEMVIAEVRERYGVIIDVDVAFDVMQDAVERRAVAGDPKVDET